MDDISEKRWLSVRRPTGVYIGWVDKGTEIKKGEMLELREARRLVSQMAPKQGGGFSQTTMLFPLDFLSGPVPVLHVRLDCYYEIDDMQALKELVEGAEEMEMGMRLQSAGLHGPAEMKNFPGDRHGG